MRSPSFVFVLTGSVSAPTFGYTFRVVDTLGVVCELLAGAPPRTLADVVGDEVGDKPHQIFTTSWFGLISFAMYAPRLLAVIRAKMTVYGTSL